MTQLYKPAMIFGFVALLAACDSMGRSSNSLEGETDVFDDEQTFGTQPSDPNA